MTDETLIIIAIRLIVPLTILRWPLAGGLLALVADASDILLAAFLDLGGLQHYQVVDKLLDTYSITLQVIVAQRWDDLPRRTATLLYVYRVAGVALFESTGNRLFLFLFPSLFESFFLFYAALRRFFPSYQLTPPRLVFWLAVLLVPKMVQEYFLHYRRALDDIVARDVIDSVTSAVVDWFRDPF
jgi:hypothetical protein